MNSIPTGATILVLDLSTKVTATPAFGSHLGEPSSTIDATEAAVQAFARDNNASAGHAREAITDQQAITAALMDIGSGTDMEPTAWIEQVGESQVITVYVNDMSMAGALRSVDVSEHSLIKVIVGAPPAASQPALTHEVERLLSLQVPEPQGMYVRERDGALVVLSHADLGQIDTAAIEGATGFDRVEIHPSGVITQNLYIRGGAALDRCTAGFPARYGSGIGFLSAGHCGTTQTIFATATAGGANTAATRRAMEYDANGDIGFYSVAGTNQLTKTFYGSSTSSPATSTSPVSVINGATVCHRGLSTGWACGTVIDNAYKPPTSACPVASCNPVFVYVSARNAPGDSGGPWVSGNQPLGIHTRRHLALLAQGETKHDA